MNTIYWENQILNTKPGKEIEIPSISKATLQSLCYRRSGGLPKGQLADYRKALPNGSGIHVKVYENRTTAHLDRVDPSVSLIGHLIADAPLVALTVGLGTAFAFNAIRTR